MRKWVLAILFLLASALLALYIHDYVRLVLLYPIAYILWSLRFIYQAVPGVVWWGIFLLLLLLLAQRSLRSKRKYAPDESTTKTPLLTRPERWTKKNKQTKHGYYFKWQFAREIGSLALNGLAQHERLTQEQVRDRLAKGALNLPPKVQAYLAAGVLARSYSHYSRIESDLRIPHQGSPLDVDIEEIVAFLERQFEL